tara:strand:+ start:101 stop:469 length:369 start_codon:yes stop_codon:yes gene_type:complete
MFSYGYLSVMISLMMSTLLTCLFLVAYVTTIYQNYVQLEQDYLHAYSSALSGLRLSGTVSQDILMVSVTNLEKKDFDQLNFFSYQDISFKLLKTATDIYSFGIHKGIHCILKKPHLTSPNLN